ncbi:LysR family transcriptional regulator (chromosome initiation inhibitor) [Microbacterium endophyticum]|uniref:LysR family transcriptional regulator (Chromosome initiation inhibitor) n=1 Tax=Microbacterium endophyticum TaxID=1526412 RepID=A0A7W4V4B0_9MICO|nr:LysR family transcriptional regulator ArgP [Microbacterium endophyticum]MBB2976622.1 LysR family transcriptional regulator (chromosome initiation inhibitor) [Microbacterium endophyticum]NIK37495.1 LysR family transcriptional regulator (chromosome initiation inhibitor) [Microbacterium endophyticum]
MNIDTELARTLAAVLDEGTMDAAARRLNVTASAVSQRVKSLEEQVGRVLLVRSKPVRATPAGMRIVRFARQVELLAHDVSAGFATSSPTSVPLAVNADSLGTWFLAPLARLSSRLNVTFDLHRDDQDFTAQLLETGQVMGAVTSTAVPVAGCRLQALGIMRYDAVASAEYAERWLAGGAVSAAFERAPVVEFDRRDDLQRQWLAARGINPSAPPRHYVPASQDFATAVHLGLGWGLLPRPQAQDGLDSGKLVALGGAHVDVPLYWQQWNLHSDLLDAVASDIVAEGRRVLFPAG